MKIIIITLFLLLFSSLFSQSYIFERMSLNAAAGHQSNGLYDATTAIGEKVKGQISTTDHIGYLGFLFPHLDDRNPMITSIDDVPYDQGHQVQIVWDKCGYDDQYAIDTYYSVWRLDEDLEILLEKARTYKLSSRSEDSNKKIEELNIFSEPFMVIENFREDSNKIYYWQKDRSLWIFIDEIPALSYSEYSYIAPTLLDSSEVDTNYSTFQVVYHDLYEFYESSPDSGYSVDNIAPDETEILITKNGSNMNISWDEIEYGTYQGNSYPEINGIWYKIFAGDTPDFICDEAHLIDTVTDLNYDYPLTGEDKKFFKVIVTDQQ